METIHATTIAVDGEGVLIRGPSGSGKSDLALRLIDGGAELVADDWTEIARDGDRVVACAPKSIAGKLEVRSLGIVELACRDTVPVALVIDLVAPEAVERLPEPRHVSLLDRDVRALELSAFETSAAAKIRLALRWRPAEAAPDPSPETEP